MTPTAYCARCVAFKPLAEFRVHRGRRNGHETYCRPCSNAYQREWRSRGTYKLRARARQRGGFTQDQADLLLATQGGCCAICRTNYPGSRGWHMDHCHATRVVRGMLCRACNHGLGQFKDAAHLLRTAAAYLDKHSA